MTPADRITDVLLELICKIVDRRIDVFPEEKKMTNVEEVLVGEWVAVTIVHVEAVLKRHLRQTIKKRTVVVTLLTLDSGA